MEGITISTQMLAARAPQAKKKVGIKKVSVVQILNILDIVLYFGYLLKITKNHKESFYPFLRRPYNQHSNFQADICMLNIILMLANFGPKSWSLLLYFPFCE